MAIRLRVTEKSLEHDQNKSNEKKYNEMDRNSKCIYLIVFYSDSLIEKGVKIDDDSLISFFRYLRLREVIGI